MLCDATMSSSTAIDGLKGTKPMTVERRCMRIAAWPERDRLAWKAGTRRAELFEPKGAGANWSPHSRIKTARGYGLWLQWLGQNRLLDPTLTPGARVTKALIADYVAMLSATCAPYTVVCRLQELYDALRVLAPDMDCRWLAELYRRLRRLAEPARNKRARLRPARDLVDLGRRMMQSAEQADGWSRRRRAVQYRDGLMIAVGAYRPLRPANFASMILGVHLVQQRRGWWVKFPASEMKARGPYEVAFPRALIPELERYLTVHRPLLLAGESGQLSPSTDALWVSEIGTMLEKGALATRIRRHTNEAFGASLPLHWFRDSAATSIAEDDPEHVCDAHHVLGNTLATTQKYYNQADSLKASRRHQAMLEALRSSLKSRRRRAG
jgi:integrase/recombinase XerD